MQSFAMLMGRAFLYLLFIVGVAQLFAMEGYALLSKSDYSESSLTEKMHDALAFSSCALFLWAARLSQSLRPAAIIVGTLVGMMLIREFDAFLDDYVFDGAWQVLVCLAIAAATIYLIKQPEPVKPSLVEFSRTSSAGIFLSGILVVLVFSRLFGRGSFWQAIMEDNYMRLVKNIAEEGTELMGYALLFIAAVEFLWTAISQRKSQQPG